MDKLAIEARLKAEVVGFSGKMAIYANDFWGNVISIDADEKFESASCIKIYILMEFFRQVHQGTLDRNKLLKYTEDNYVVGSGILRALDFGVEMTAANFAKLMIIISDNIATNTLIKLLGRDNINNTCKEMGFSNTVLHNDINFVKYDRLGTTTPEDYGRFFEMLAKEEIWSNDISREMLDIFRNQHYNRMLTKDLPHYYLDSEDTKDEEMFYVSSKSGSMDACRNDGGIIHTPFGNYVLVIFTKNFKDPLYYNDHESYRYGSKVSRLIFDQYIALKGKLS